MRQLLSAIAGLLLATAAVAAPVPKGLLDVGLFPHTVGDKWEYLDAKGQPSHVEEVTAVEERDGAKFVTITRSRNGREALKSVFRVDGDGVARVSVGPLDYSPPMLILKQNQGVNDGWTVKLTIGKAVTEYELTVGKAEEVTVPGGKFTAIPVRMQNLKNKSAAPLEYWYASGIGLVQSSSGGKLTTSLKSFTPGRKR